MSEKTAGTVKWHNEQKGYSFAVNETGEDVFIHYQSIMADGFKTLAAGQQIRCTQVQSEKGWQAAEVEVLETA